MDYKLEESHLYTRVTSGHHRLLSKGELMSDADIRTFIHVVTSGYIKRYSIDNDGAQSIQVIYGPGDIFPLTPVFKRLYNLDIYRGPDTFFYEAMCDSEIASLDHTTLEQSTQIDPLIYRDLLYISGIRLNSNIQQLESTALRTTNRRIAHLIAYYADKFGEEQEQGIMIKVPLTHQNLADILNMARETITRRLVRLEEKGLLIAGKNIVVLDLPGLKKEFK
jgi:CRP/FNR family transcriptional regulator